MPYCSTWKKQNCADCHTLHLHYCYMQPILLYIIILVLYPLVSQGSVCASVTNPMHGVNHTLIISHTYSKAKGSGNPIKGKKGTP